MTKFIVTYIDVMRVMCHSFEVSCQGLNMTSALFIHIGNSKNQRVDVNNYTVNSKMKNKIKFYIDYNSL